jgi:DNA sulfur modification protein DndC
LWRTDPIEPDWEDSVPKIYLEVFGKELQWASDDDATFSKLESDVLSQLENRHGIPKELVMKLVELELSLEGLSKRASIFRRIEDILSQDWGGVDESVARQTARGHQLIDRDEEENSLSERYKTVSGMLNHAS